MLIFHVLMCLKLLISALCNKASNQLNAIGRIQKHDGFKEKNFFLIVLYIQTLIIVLLFGSSKSLYNIEKIQILRLLPNDFDSDYAELLLFQVKPQWK